MSFSTTNSIPMHTEVMGWIVGASVWFCYSAAIFISFGVQILGWGYKKYRSTWKKDSFTGLCLSLQTNAQKTE